MQNGHQILFLSHGGGPMPLLGDEGHKEMVECLTKIKRKIRKPSALLVISAHWEESVVTITEAERPPLIYDYYGFPEESYRITYPCPGEPELARQAHQLLISSGIPSNLVQQRGFDHGLFVPLKIMFPEADIPAVQVSLLHNLSADDHLAIGAALKNLEYQDLLIIGSGFSFHNMKAFFSPESEKSIELNEAFETWLIDTCSNSSMSEDERYQRFARWEDAPAARFCHPREEHLLPLHVCYGAAQTSCTDYFEMKILNKKSSMYFWSGKR